MLNTPVAFFIFNRPSLTEVVFEAIRKAKPKKLLVIADGPRFPEEIEKCEKARTIIDKIDWECNLLVNFSEYNLGCKKRLSTGLNWVFTEVEQAIILEDDCLPTPSFFNFCELLLERYRNDERVMMISGNNFQNGQSRTEYSYYFSKYSHIWGWASWRRAWNCYDVEMKTWPEYRETNIIKSICDNLYEEKYWTEVFDKTFAGLIDTWDYQWLYTCWNQSGFSIVPNCNLVSNIGFGSDGTHCIGDSSWTRLPTFDIWDIKHPPFIYRNQAADIHTFDIHYGGKFLKERDYWIFQLKHYLQSGKNYIKSKIKGTNHV